MATRTDPYPNEHAARLVPPGEFVSFARKEIAPGVTLILGKREGADATETQSVRFSREKFTAQQARDWLAEHGHKPLEFEEAAGRSDGYAVRVDSVGDLLRPHKTRDGFGWYECRLMRPGVLEYKRQDGTTVRELIPEEEIRRASTLASIAGKPVTVHHPARGRVTADSAAQDSVGAAMNEIVYDEEEGGFVKVKLIVQRQDGLDFIGSGGNQVSAGKLCRVDHTPGVHPKWGSYDAVQRDIFVNHIALTQKGRAGPSVALRVDESEDYAYQETIDMADKTLQERLDELKDVDVTKLDASDLMSLITDMAGEMTKLRRRLEKADESGTASKAEMDKLRGEYDALKAEYDEFKTKADGAAAEKDADAAAMREKMDGMVEKPDEAAVLAERVAWMKERVQLLSLPETAKLDEADLDKVSNAQLRRLLAARIQPSMRADASDDYVQGVISTRLRNDADLQWADIGKRLVPPPKEHRADESDTDINATSPYKRAYEARQNPTT